ncbi:TadE/TadG family type IV pilus assembly protein [Rothia amarae]|uniref:TadE/TadG family type IV pilus assembly protein n=1 Tax=Rothia amarae TaxID=169480 RepID=UPI0032178056
MYSPLQNDTKERGNVTAEFVMVSALVLMLFGVVLQIAFALYARNIMLDAASAGARYGTLLDRTESEGRTRTEEIIAGGLPDIYQTTVSSSAVTVNGVDAIEIKVHGTLPVVGPFGFDQGIEVSGHAIVQK